MSIHKVNNRYVVKTRDLSGKQHSRTLKVGTSKADALLFEVEFKAELKEFNTAPENILIETLLERHYSTHLKRLVKPEGYRSHIDNMLPYIEGERLADVSRVANAMKDEMLELEYKPATIVQRVGLLRAIAKRAAGEWEITDIDYGLRIKKPKIKNSKVLFISPEELNNIYTHLKKDCEESAELMMFAAYTGIRKAELERLKEHCVEKRGPDTWLTIEESKEGTPRTLHLCENAKTAYENLIFGIPIGVSYWIFSHAFKRAVKASEAAKNNKKLLKATWHDLRHSFASNLAQEGATIIELQSAMGHKTLQSTMRYAHLCDATATKTKERLDNAASKVRPILVVI